MPIMNKFLDGFIDICLVLVMAYVICALISSFPIISFLVVAGVLLKTIL
jgi:hypothetical protein